MIIEIFGPPGAGKTTFAHALARQLSRSGHRTNVMLSHRPGEGAGHGDSLGVVLFLARIMAALVSTVKILASAKGRKENLGTCSSMVRLIPPARRMWRARLWQYILHLSCCWNQARQSSDIVIFDQGFVQAVGSLAIFNGGTECAVLAKALSLTPRADVTIRVSVPRGVAEARLRQRITRELPAERIFEADLETNMRSFGVFQKIDELMAASGRTVIPINTADAQSAAEGIRHVESAIASEILQAHEAHTAQGDQVPSKPLAAGASGSNEYENLRPDHFCASVVDPRNLPAIGSEAIMDFRFKEDMGRRLVKASVLALVIYIGGAGLTSLAQLLIARLIGPRNYGIYSYALAWTSVLAYLATLGFNVSLLRFLPAYRATGRLDLARGVITFALRNSLAAATLCALIGATLIVVFADHSQRSLEISNLLGMAAIPLITAYALGATLVRAFGGVASALLPERIVRDGLLLILVAIAALSGLRAVDAPTVMLAVVISSAMTVALVFMTSARLQPPGLREVEPSYAKSEWWSAVPPLLLITGLDVFVSRTGVMVLGWTQHIREAGVFALALNVATLVGLSRIAVSTMFSPTAADLHARGDRMALQQLFARATMLSLGGAVVVAIPLMAIAGPFLAFFGEGFAAGASVTRVLILAYVFVALCGPQVNLLTMTGNEWAAATTMVAGAVANIAACSLGVAVNGALGAAVGVALALVIWNIGMAAYIAKRLDILPGVVVALLSLKRGRAGRWDWF